MGRNLHPDFKISVRNAPNKEYYKSLDEKERNYLNRLTTEMDKHWKLEDLTTFVYAIPKKPDMNEEERKYAQREFFKNVYQMLIDNDTGPRLPTFLLALGKKKAKDLLNIK